MVAASRVTVNLPSTEPASLASFAATFEQTRFDEDGQEHDAVIDGVNVHTQVLRSLMETEVHDEVVEMAIPVARCLF